MKRKFGIVLLSALAVAGVQEASGKTWTLDECIQYAMDNNITLKRQGITRQTSRETALESKAQLLPSLSGSTSQSVTYNPWQKSGTSMVSGSQVESTSDKVVYSGSYAVSVNWTVWNGNRNRNTLKQNKLAETQAEVDSIVQARSIEEQIAQLYVQILYTKEAVKVNQATLEAAKVNENRGLQMVEVGSMSKAEASELTAERAQDEYNVVQAQSQVRNYTRQLKELLEITDDAAFDVAVPETTKEMALQSIPSMQSVYEQALSNRPELRAAQLNVESAELQQKIARAQNLPTVSLNAGISASTNSMSSDSWGNQMKYNSNISGGVTVSVPILDQRSKRTAINKANLQREDALLQVRDEQTSLYSTIENYWINAENYQNEYKAAMVSTESAQESYNLLSEQFNVGLKNIVELQEGKTRLLSAQQSELQSKYMTILNIKMLEFYRDKGM